MLNDKGNPDFQALKKAYTRNAMYRIQVLREQDGTVVARFPEAPIGVPATIKEDAVTHGHFYMGIESYVRRAKRYRDQLRRLD